MSPSDVESHGPGRGRRGVQLCIVPISDENLALHRASIIISLVRRTVSQPEFVAVWQLPGYFLLYSCLAIRRMDECVLAVLALC